MFQIVLIITLTVDYNKAMQNNKSKPNKLTIYYNE